MSAFLWVGLGGAATLLRDIHGPPLLAGALAALWIARSVPLPSGLSETPSETSSR